MCCVDVMDTHSHRATNRQTQIAAEAFTRSHFANVSKGNWKALEKEIIGRLWGEGRVEYQDQPIEPQVLRFLQTLVSADGELPEYYCAAMLDDVEIYHYDSNSERIVSRIPSVQTAVREQRFPIRVEEVKTDYMWLKEKMLYMMKSRNIMSGAHYAQAITGCEVREDGTTDEHFTVAFDGEDFLSFDKNDLRWISAVPEAQTLRQKLDNDRDMNQDWKQVLENDCPTWMEEYYQYSKSTFQRQSRPDVSVSYRRDVGGRALLSCLVTGFYPRPIEVTWTRDGNTVHEVESSGVLPNHDHTFQTVKQMELETGSAGEQGFSCLVEHSSLQGVLEVPWDGKTGRTPAGSTSWILGLIIGALLVSGIVEILVWKRKRERKGEESGQSSNGQLTGTRSE
ncbi:zinc-alpha-2-glycoprotein-like isoform X2 [Callorhinchus milii]|uniref:zinc-alpha-2-glycoprotein-like isoform X2 n=1 Tax=Callorhinchus milii TaxID=7868 RepID=UPI001C3FAE75|nr:zinc-alpha-2-glycoprotein-like isoform X2 [Callorhinchus milii]